MIVWCCQAPTSSAAVSASSGTPVSKRPARPSSAFAEDGRFPECERLEPRERLDVTVASARVSLDELAARRKAVARCDRGCPERIFAASGLTVGRDEIADVGARVADGAHLPVEHCSHPLRLLVRDHDVPEAIIPVDDGCG